MRNAFIIGMILFVVLGWFLGLTPIPTPPKAAWDSADECFTAHWSYSREHPIFLSDKVSALKRYCAWSVNTGKGRKFENDVGRVPWEFVLKSPLSQQEARWLAYIRPSL